MRGAAELRAPVAERTPVHTIDARQIRTVVSFEHIGAAHLTKAANCRAWPLAPVLKKFLNV